MDSQSVKTSTNVPTASQGIDAGKRIVGRKRGIITDTLGLLLAVIVTAASVSDNTIGIDLLNRATRIYPTLTKAWVDAGFRTKVVEHGATLGVDVEIVTKDPQVKGFSVIKRRWVVERTIGWLMQHRRLARDYETLPATSATMIRIAMIDNLTKRAVQLPDEQSRPTRFRRGGFRTARQAQTARNQTVASAAAGAGPRRVTVEQWLRRWLLSLPGQVRRSTAAGYSIHVRRYLIPHLGHHTLTGLRAAHIEAMFTTITAQPSRTGAPLSAATLQKIRATLRRALNMAIREQLLAINPARLVLLPRPRRHRPQPWSASRVAAWQANGCKPVVAVWTPQQLAEFLLFVRDDPLFALWWLAALRGLRRGEICALRWTDVDLAEGTLTVSHTIAHANGRPYWDTPKTAAGQRTVALDRMTVAVLLRSQRQQRRQAQCAGERWRPDGPVFTRQGRAIRPDWLTHRFATLVAASGLPPIRLHCLRHGAATLALAAHVDLKTVQDMLGHTSYAFTADTYATVLPDQAKHAAESTARLVLNALHKACTAAGAGSQTGS